MRSRRSRAARAAPRLAFLLVLLISLASLAVPVRAASSSDLTVGSVWVEKSSAPGQPATVIALGEQFNIVATIKNIGAATANGYYVDVYYDSKYGRGGPDIIARGEAQEWYVGPLTAESGSHTARWLVDPDNQIPETNESNNENAYVFTIGTPTATPTLILSPTSGPIGAQVSASGSNYRGSTCVLTAVPSNLFTSHTCSITSGMLAGGFTVASGSGNYAVTVQTSVGSGDSATSTFTVALTPTITFYTDSASGTLTVDGLTKTNGTTETYSAGQRVHVIANPPSSGYSVYWESSEVLVENQLSQDTYITISNSGWLKAHFIASPIVQSSSFFHPHTEFWFSRYDMVNATWDAIHIVNVGSANATVQITIGTSAPITDSLSLGVGEATYRTYPGKAGGPVHIVSDQLIWATQRILGWTAMQEIYGMPGDVPSTDIIFTWYDLVYASSDDIYVINPSASQIASVDIYVADVLRGHLDVAPGQEAVTSFPGVIGGPLRVRSDIPVLASQRVIGFGDFAEIVGLPSWYTSTDAWFNWYDMKGASWDAIHMLNPGTSTANVDIYVNGTLRASLSLAAGAADYRTFPGLIGGPVRIVSTQPIWVTQRIIGWGGWKEVYAVSATLATTEWYFTWYDMRYAGSNAIHIMNPSTSEASVSVYVGGELRSTLSIPSGQVVYVTYSGVMTGPVRVVSNVPIISSQRILGWGSFEETIGASLA